MLDVPREETSSRGAYDLAQARRRLPAGVDLWDILGTNWEVAGPLGAGDSWVASLNASFGDRVPMVLPAVKTQILSDLDQLSPEKQKRAAELVHQLVPPPKGISGRDLLRFAGILDAESAREMEEAIEEGCERVDLDEW